MHCRCSDLVYPAKRTGNDRSRRGALPSGHGPSGARPRVARPGCHPSGGTAVPPDPCHVVPSSIRSVLVFQAGTTSCLTRRSKPEDTAEADPCPIQLEGQVVLHRTLGHIEAAALVEGPQPEPADGEV